jgi:ferrous-iron efflux pump FieF
MSFGKGHRVADRVDVAVQAALPTAEVLVHQEPAKIADVRLDDRIGLR